MTQADQMAFTVLFLQDDRDDFFTLPLSVPQDKKVRDLHAFLAEHPHNPFPAFFLTNRVKEKPQFGMDKLVKDVLEQCRRDSGGRSVLLCYEEKQTEGMSKIESSSKHIRQEKEKRQQERQK